MANIVVNSLVNEKNLSKESKIKPMNFDVMCQRLKSERIKADLSQKQVAHIIGITQSHYATYEKGNNTIPITRLIKLSKTYKVSIDYLMGKCN